MMDHNCLCDSAENLIPAKPGSQGVGEMYLANKFDMIFLILIFNMLKAIRKQIYFMICNAYFQSVLFQSRNQSIDFQCKFIDCTLYEYEIVFKFFKNLFSEYFSPNSLVVFLLS